MRLEFGVSVRQDGGFERPSGLLKTRFLPLGLPEFYPKNWLIAYKQIPKLLRKTSV